MKKLLRYKTFLKRAFYGLFFLGIFLFLSYRLTEIPPGINFDESSIGYNASLISDRLRDENGRFLPVFILTLDGKDWKQPSNVYATALIFKIFGKTYFNFKLISVIYALISGFLFFKLLRIFFSESLSFIGLALFLSSPSILIQSHLVLENMALLPFFLAWLYFLLSYSLRPKNGKLLFSGIALGLSLYSYKGMRAMVPVYLGLSVFYLAYLNFYPLPFGVKTLPGKFFEKIKPLIWFGVGVGPFILPLKWLNVHYAEAVFDPAIVHLSSFYELARVYFSSFDFSFLFVKGDLMSIHSTGRHGMFLAPTFFLLFLGFFQLAKEKKKEYYFILWSLILTPLLLTTVGSVYRASRLMMYIPLLTFFFTLGVKRLLNIKTAIFRRLLLMIFSITLIFCYFDFATYYFGAYPKTISQDFAPNFNEAFNQLAQNARQTGKTPYLEYADYNLHKADMQFFREIHFPDQDVKMWDREIEVFPETGLVLTSIGGSKEFINYGEIPSLQSGQKTFFVVGKKE